MIDHIERVNRAIEEFRAGRMVVLVDDEDRENEGDLCLAAERVTPEGINFTASCVARINPSTFKLNSL